MASIPAVSNRISVVPTQWLPLLRMSVIVILVILDVFFVIGIPDFYTQLTTLCTLPNCHPLVLTTNDVEMLESVGLTANFYALVQIGIEIVNALFVNFICIYYLRRFMTHWMGYVASLIFVLFLIMPNVIWAFLFAHPSLLFIGELILDITNLAFFSFVYIFPTGRFAPRWSIIFLMLGLSQAVFGTVVVYYDDFTGTSFADVYFSPFMISMIAGISFQIYRYIHISDHTQRLQTKWVILGLCGPILGVFSWGYFMEYLAFLPDAPRVWIHLFSMPIIMVITVVPLPIALTIAITEQKLWNIDLIFNRTLVYIILTAIILTVYIFLVTMLNIVFGVSNNLVISLFMTIAVVLSFQMVRQTIQRGVNRLMFGQRDEPHTVLMNLSQQLQTAVLPEDLLQLSTESIAKSLKLPYVAIVIQHGADETTQTIYGTNDMPTQSFPLVYQNESIGQLIIGQRSPTESLNSSDNSVLSGIAQQLGAVVFAVRLQSELQTAREKLVIAREEERRRLRRDLHDGLGPSLASLPLKVDAAIDLIEQDRDMSVKLLHDVKTQAQDLVADVRRVVHDLRPPTLDEFGLVEALRGAIAQFRTHPNGLGIEFEADKLPDNIPAAVEAATYHIIMEAITNVIKHAQAHQCWIDLHVMAHPSRLQMTIDDDGIGLPELIMPNVGLHSMRERAEELGGTFSIQSRPTGGTRIIVSLPISEGNKSR